MPPSALKVLPRPHPHDIAGGTDDQLGPTPRHVRLLLRSGHTISTDVRAEYAAQWEAKITEALNAEPGSAITWGSIRLPTGMVAVGEVVGMTITGGDQ